MIPVRLSRRSFLETLGLGAGAGLLMPLMRTAAAQDAGEMPRRVVIVMTGNGLPSRSFHSAASLAALDAAPPVGGPLIVPPGELASARALAALAGGDGQLDLTEHAAALHGLSSVITGGSHTAESKALSCTKGRGQTIDTWLSDRLHTHHPFPALRFSVTPSRTEQLQYSMCMKTGGRQLPLLANPVDAHTAMFGSIATGAGEKLFTSRAALIDFARDDVAVARRQFIGGSRERQKLDHYLAAIEELGAQQERLRLAGDDLRALCDREGIDPDSGAALNSDHILHRLDGQYTLATAALLGDLTPMVLIGNHVGSAFAHSKYTSLADLFDVPADEVPWRHGVCHEERGNAIYGAVLDRVIERQVELIARMARRLAEVPEGDGTMLDHTAIVFMSDNGDAHHSTARNWPMLVLGGRALGLSTGGRTIVYPGTGDAANRRVSNMFNTLGHAIGHPLDDWGGEADKHLFAGPLAELMA